MAWMCFQTSFSVLNVQLPICVRAGVSCPLSRSTIKPNYLIIRRSPLLIILGAVRMRWESSSDTIMQTAARMAFSLNNDCL